MTIRNTSAGIMAAALVAGVGAAAAASAAADKPAAVLMPLRENDGNPYIKELPGKTSATAGGSPSAANATSGLRGGTSPSGRRPA